MKVIRNLAVAFALLLASLAVVNGSAAAAPTINPCRMVTYTGTGVAHSTLTTTVGYCATRPWCSKVTEQRGAQTLVIVDTCTGRTPPIRRNW